MPTTQPLSAVSRTESDMFPVNEAPVSAVSWSAVLGGAFIAAAMALILTLLGTGLGLSAISPWSNSGASSTTIGIAGVVWLIFMQVVAASMGGYLAGRLRTKWVDVHTDEVFFRDTAHGFLAWAVAVVISAGALAAATSSLVGAGVQGAATGAGMAAATAATQTPSVRQQFAARADGEGYYVDALFRADHRSGDVSDASTRMEAARILAAALRAGDIAQADKTYLSQWVASRTGLNQVDADKRVADTVAQEKAALADAETKARDAADAARKAGAYLALWMFVALLAGALCACYAATIGGRQRDAVVV